MITNIFLSFEPWLLLKSSYGIGVDVGGGVCMYACEVSPSFYHHYSTLLVKMHAFSGCKNLRTTDLFTYYFCTLVVAKCTNHRDDQIRNNKHQLCNHFNSSAFVVERRIFITALQNTNQLFVMNSKKSSSTLINIRRL